MKAKIGPGSLCWMNSKCGIARNVGIVVEVIELAVIEDGMNVWHIHSSTPMMCIHARTPILRTFRTCCSCEEIALTLINGDETEDTTTKVTEHDTSGVL